MTLVSTQIQPALLRPHPQATDVVGTLSWDPAELLQANVNGAISAATLANRPPVICSTSSKTLTRLQASRQLRSRHMGLDATTPGRVQRSRPG